jgi:hypothetical protein
LTIQCDYGVDPGIDFIKSIQHRVQNFDRRKFPARVAPEEINR